MRGTPPSSGGVRCVVSAVFVSFVLTAGYGTSSDNHARSTRDAGDGEHAGSPAQREVEHGADAAPPHGAPRDIVRAYYSATVDRKGEKACSLLADDMRREFGLTALAACGDQIVKASARERAPRITTVEVEGAFATVGVEQRGETGQVKLRRQHGSWRIVDFEGATGQEMFAPEEQPGSTPGSSSGGAG
jgi:hypothetical protein